MSFLNVLCNVAILLCMALPGFILEKIRALPEKSIKSVSVIYLYVSFPFLVLSSFLKNTYEPRLLLNMGVIALLSLAVTIAGYFVAKLVFSFSKEELAGRACVAGTFLSNSGFFGIPLLMMLFPDNPEPVLYAAALGIPGNMVLWTLGIYAVSGNKKYVSVKKIFLNPPTVALAVALPLFFLKVNLPAEFISSVNYLGNMCMPLSMIVMGIRIAQFGFKKLFTSFKVYLSAALKLIVLPLLTLGLSLAVNCFFAIDRLVIVVLFVLMATPSAGSLASMAELSGGDGATAAMCMLCSTLFCVVTLPLLLQLVKFI